MSRIILALAMLAIHILIPVNIPAAARPSQSQPVLNWNGVNIPSQDSLIAPGSDVLQLVTIGESLLYSVVRTDGYHLYCSNDGGYQWERFAQLEDGFVEIINNPDEAGVLYYATASSVFRSQDGGRSFSILPWLPGVDGEDVFITAVAAREVEGQEMVSVATASRLEASRGDVYLLRPGEILARWRDSGLEGFNAYEVEFFPEDDGLVLVVVGIQEGKIVIKTMAGSAGWSNTWSDGVFPCGSGDLLELKGVSLVFPAGFNPLYPSVLVGLNTEEGGVYRVTLADYPLDTEVYRLTRDGVAVSSLDAGSNGVILAGSAGVEALQISNDHGVTWERFAEAPTGETVASVLVTSEGFYVATGGGESAVSRCDDGNHWRQIAWIDTRLDSLLDFALSPQYHHDDTLYLISWGGTSSLWRSTNGGKNWVRCLNSAATGGVFEKICLSPEFGSSQKVLYLAGEDLNSPCIWRSIDGGASFTARKCPLKIDCWKVVGNEELLAGSFNGRDGVILRTQNAGLSYSQSLTGEAPIHSLVCNSDSPGGRWVLAGDSVGNVYFSEDSGVNFCRLPNTENFSGAVSVAFDRAFNENNRIFVASDLPGEGVYTATIAEEIAWKKLGEEKGQADFRMGELAVADSGLVYVADLQSLNEGAGRGGVMRVLDAGQSLEKFEIITRGMETGCSVRKLVSAGKDLWAMDIASNRLLCWTDTLGEPPELKKPLAGAENIGTSGDGYVSQVEIEWESVPGATSYRWQVSKSSSFSTVQSDLEGSTVGEGATLPLLEAENSYFWRVMAMSPVSSPWSEVRKFKTALATSVAAPHLEKPLPGEKNVVAKPLFQWEKIEKADLYELVVSDSPDFDETIITCTGEQALTANAWQAGKELEYGTGYFWKVRALDAGGESEWSGVGSFRTADEAVQPEPSVTPPCFTTVTLPVTTVVNIGDITVVVSQAPGSNDAVAVAQMPQWGKVIIALLGVVLLTLLVILVAVVTKKPK